MFGFFAISRGFEEHIRIGYLLGHINDNTILIDGVYVPEQKSTRVNVHVAENVDQRAFEAVEKMGKHIVGTVTYRGDILNLHETEWEKDARESIHQLGAPNG